MTLTTPSPARPMIPARPVPLHVVRDPQPGDEVTVPAGARLVVRFRRRGLGLSRWQVLDRPGHLVPLEESDHGFLFLVFEGGDDRPLRLVRRRVDRADRGEVRDLTVRVG
jgi:hypothetical protein